MTNTRLPAPQRGFPPDIGSQWRTVSAGPCIVSSYFKGYRSRHFSANYDKSDLVGDFMAVLDNLFNNYLRVLCVRILRSVVFARFRAPGPARTPTTIVT